MVSSKVKVISKSVDSNESYMWESEGIDGYTIEPCQKENRGTTIILKLKEDTEDEKYSRFLEEYVIQELIKKIFRLYTLSNKNGGRTSKKTRRKRR